jgi:hypothetical protein
MPMAALSSPSDHTLPGSSSNDTIISSSRARAWSARSARAVPPTDRLGDMLAFCGAFAGVEAVRAAGCRRLDRGGVAMVFIGFTWGMMGSTEVLARPLPVL